MTSVTTDFKMGETSAVRENDASGMGRATVLLYTAVAGLVLLALFARIMMEDLRHDEHMFVAAGALLGTYALYGDFSYSHLPNLALFLSGLFELAGSSHYLLIARMSLFATWILFLLGMYLTATQLSGRRFIGLFAVLLLVTDQLFISHVGMVVSNNIYAATLAIYGLFFFLTGLKADQRRALWIALAGLFLSLAAGVKANFIVFVLPIAMAAVLLPAHLAFRDRLLKVVLPLAVGGLIGALPTFAYLAAHGDVMIFNVFDFHTGPHRAYWSEPAHAATVTGMTLPSRVFYAYQLWTAGSTVLIFLGALGLVTVAALHRGLARALTHFADGRTLLVLALVLAGIAICFPVLPSFPQYYMPPIPFAIVLIAALYGRLDTGETKAATPLLATFALAALVLGGPRLLADLPSIMTPERWTPVKVHGVAADIGEAVSETGKSGPLATLVPIYALEAGLDVYPELGTGPFYYRIGDYLTAEDREAFRVASPATLEALFDRNPPAAILSGYEGKLDQPLERYGWINGYETLPTPFGEDRYGRGKLMLAAP